MKNLFYWIVTFSALILGIVFLSTILTSLFIGSGYIISLVFNFTLFNSTALCIGVAFVFSFIIFIAIHGNYQG